MDDIKLMIRGLLQKYFQNHEPDDDENIFATGFISSLFAMQLVLLVEGYLNAKLDNEDITLDNFRSINSITGLINRKLQGGNFKLNGTES